jgi:hypothetical protein
MRRFGLLLLGFLLSGGAAHAGTSPAKFVSYQGWATVDESSRAMYIAGDLDGMFGMLAGAPAAFHFQHCLIRAKATPNTISAAVYEFAKGKPELHMLGMHEVLMVYLVKACGPPPEQ